MVKMTFAEKFPSFVKYLEKNIDKAIIIDPSVARQVARLIFTHKKGMEETCLDKEKVIEIIDNYPFTKKYLKMSFSLLKEDLKKELLK